MRTNWVRLLAVVALGGCCVCPAAAQPPQASSRGHSTQGSWSAEEYSGMRSIKDQQVAMASKAFAWLSGSPADNEKLSIGKNAQFFGFVALRYESGRAANRGALGRAFYCLVDADQRKILLKLVNEESPLLTAWWKARGELLRIYEGHLYTGAPIVAADLTQAGEAFAQIGAKVALAEAEGFARLESSLREDQRAQLAAWRRDPESARGEWEGARITGEGLSREQGKQLEDLYAKAFSWFTGNPRHNEIIPLGQPAQFFGFVSIRHKSGHAANRGRISKSFRALLDPAQQVQLDRAAGEVLPVVQRFLAQRHLFLEELARLRHDPTEFDADGAMTLALAMGRLETEVGRIEAEAYRRIRESMTDRQITAMMALRGDYVIDPDEVELLTDRQRGERLALLCAGCHGPAGNYQRGMLAPNLDGMFDRPIARASDYEYSRALLKLRETRGPLWSDSLLDEYLLSPQAAAPGTKMEFQGLLGAQDRQVLIEYLKRTR